MSERQTITRATPMVLLAVVAAGAAFVVGAGPQLTDASWTVTKTFAVNAVAIIPNRPTALTCPASGGILTPVPLTWTAPPGTTPSGYTLKWTGNETGSSTWPTPSGTVTPPLIGFIIVSVYADYGNWQSLAGTQTRRVDNLGSTWGCGP
jgi:hypothetical protein